MSLMFSLKVGGHNKMFSFSDSYRPLKEEYEFKGVSHSLIYSDEFRKKIARNKLLTGEEYYNFDTHDGFYLDKYAQIMYKYYTDKDYYLKVLFEAEPDNTHYVCDNVIVFESSCVSFIVITSGEDEILTLVGSSVDIYEVKKNYEGYHNIREDDNEIFISSADFSSKLIRK